MIFVGIFLKVEVGTSSPGERLEGLALASIDSKERQLLGDIDYGYDLSSPLN